MLPPHPSAHEAEDCFACSHGVCLLPKAGRIGIMAGMPGGTLEVEPEVWPRVPPYLMVQ